MFRLSQEVEGLTERLIEFDRDNSRYQSSAMYKKYVQHTMNCCCGYDNVIVSSS